MIKKLPLLVLTVILASSCVSKKIYTDLESKYANLKKENRALADQNTALSTSKNNLQNTLDKLQRDYDATVANFINSSFICIYI